MQLNSLHLIHFKNHLSGDLKFGKQVNCLLGDNGSGKTNILDALHYLCFCKSYFNPIDSQNISHGEPFMMIKGVFNHHGNEEIVMMITQARALPITTGLLFILVK